MCNTLSSLFLLTAGRVQFSPGPLGVGRWTRRIKVVLLLRWLLKKGGMQSLESGESWKIVRSPVHRASCTLCPCLTDQNVHYLKIHTHYRWAAKICRHPQISKYHKPTLTKCESKNVILSSTWSEKEIRHWFKLYKRVWRESGNSSKDQFPDGKQLRRFFLGKIFNRRCLLLKKNSRKCTEYTISDGKQLRRFLLGRD